MDNYTSENTLKFLEAFKKLEYIETIEPDRYAKIKRANYQTFESLRHIRNCLTHTPKSLNDEYPFHVSNSLLESIETLVHQIVSKALDEGTKIERIRVAHPNDYLMETIKLMDKYNYSNLPVLDENGILQYVVSNRAILSALANYHAVDDNQDYKINELKDYFGLEANKDIYYDFMSKEAYAYDAKMKFIGYRADHKRCALIFITNNGRKNEPVLGIVSPRDVLDI